MAAGMGSRYGGLKQIDPVGPSGELVIDYSVYDALRAGFGKVVFIIRRDIEEDFRAVVESHIRGRIPIAYAFQELEDVPDGFQVPEARTKPWGTGHAIFTCRNLVHEPFGVINADDFYGAASFRTLAAFLRQSDPSASAFALVAYILRNTLSGHGSVTRGVCRIRDGLLREVVERMKIEPDGDAARYLEADQWHPLTGEEPVSMNMWGFTPELFRYLDAGFPEFLRAEGANPKAEYLIPTVVDELVRAGSVTVRALHSDARWLGVTYPEDKAAVAAGIRALVDQGAYPPALWKGQ
jgi:dTDP-glucose pyrophosphorylase